MALRTCSRAAGAAAPLAATLLLVAAGCGGGEEPLTPRPGRDRPVVVVTTYPLRCFTERIAGDSVEVTLPVEPGEDPLHWRPDRDELAAMQDADLLVFNGAGAERWANTASLPASRTVDTSAAFADRLIEVEGVTHTHGASGGKPHTHKGTDPHTWLDPRNARLQVAAIGDALARLLPAHAADLEARRAELVRELDALDAGFRALGAQPDGTFLYASHAAYDYLAQHYGWRVVNLDLDPAGTLDDTTVAAIRTQLETRPGRFILWESTPAPAIAARLSSELGLQSVVFSPCEAAPDDGGDYFTVMRANLERIQAAFSP